MSLQRSTAAELVVSLARRAANRGGVPATSGEFSVRLGPDRFLIAAGADQGALEAVLEVDGHGRPRMPGRRPPTETGLHLSRYAADARIGAIVHVHSTNAVLASRRFADAVVLEGFELLKAFAGCSTHEARLVVPIVDNHQDLAVLAERAEAAIAAVGSTWAYLVRGHGLYTWGPDPDQADRHAEALDILLHYAWLEAR
ncbi:MAG: methylthioribulose 1-phosphate dehydratase [Myxococcota bacterium]